MFMPLIRARLFRLLLLGSLALLGGCQAVYRLLSLEYARFVEKEGSEEKAIAKIQIFAAIALASTTEPTPTPGPTASGKGEGAGRAAADEAEQVLFVVEPNTGVVLFRREGSLRWEPLNPSGGEVRLPVLAIHGAPDGRSVILGAAGGIFLGDLLGGTMAVATGADGTRMQELTCGAATPRECWAAGSGPTGSQALLRSTDGGKSWVPGGSGLPGGFDPMSALFSPAAGVVLVTAVGEMYRSADGGASFTKVSGLPFFPSPIGYASQGGALFTGISGGAYKSLDGGVTWTKTAGALPAAPPTGIAGRGSWLFVSIYDVGTPPGKGGVYRSSDGGSSWTRVVTGLPRAQVNTLAATARALYAGTNAGAFRSTDDGASWSAFRGGMAYADTRAVLETGGRLYQGTYAAGNAVYRSSDGGKSWQPGSEALDSLRVLSLAAGDDAVLAGTESTNSPSSGVFRTTDGGGTWSAANGGIPVASSGISIHGLAASGRTFFAVGRGGSAGSRLVYRSTDSGASWVSVVGQLPQTPGASLFAAAIVPFGSGRVIVVGGDGGVARSTDEGGTWSPLAPVSTPDTWVSALASSGTTLFAAVSSLSGAPGTVGVFASGDQGATWSPYGSGFPLGSQFRNVTSLAFHGPTVFAGTGAGVYATSDGGATWISPRSALGFVSSMAVLGDYLWVGVRSGGLTRIDLSGKARRLVPIVLDVSSGTARFTTELSLVNRGSSSVPVTLRYTASLGAGSGTVSLTIGAGQQMILEDVIATLRQRGLAIPIEGAQAGTLLVTFEGVSDPTSVAATARTASATGPPQPSGRAGLAYSALREDQASTSVLTVYGLRSNVSDRSNLAVFSCSDSPVTLRVTLWSGSGDGRKAVVAEAEVLPPYGWKQYSGLLDAAGMSTGWVTVERTSSIGSFSSYGVVNDNGTNDGSYVLPVGTVLPMHYLSVPVVVETSTFRSELVLTNKGSASARLAMTYLESLSPGSGTGGTVSVTLAPGEQRIVPEAIDFLRSAGVTIGAKDAASYVGAVHVAVTGVPASDAFVGARTAARSPSAGQFGLFTPPLYPGDEATEQAFVYGLRADEGNRSNVAVVNAGTGVAEPITLEVRGYDGEAGGAEKGEPWVVTLQPGEWRQESGFLGSRGIRSGWIKATRTSGSAGWAVYGVVNDGGQPQQRTDDGAYVPMVR